MKRKDEKKYAKKKVAPVAKKKMEKKKDGMPADGHIFDIATGSAPGIGVFGVSGVFDDDD